MMFFNINKILKSVILFFIITAGFAYSVLGNTAKSSDKIYLNSGMTSEKINSIINQAKPGSKIIFKKGIYKLNNGLDIRKKHNLDFISEKDVFLILEKITWSVIWISDSDNLSFTGFHAKHRDLVFPGEVCNGAVIAISDSHDIFLSNLELNGSGTQGVWINQSTSVSIKNSFIHSNSVAGISLIKFADNIIIEHNRFENNPKHIESNFLNDDEWSKYVIMKDNSFDVVIEKK